MAAYIEREGIMADSGIKNISAAFDDSERWELEVKAKHCLDWYSLEERREFLKRVEYWRGEVGRKHMEAAIMVEWNKRKAAA